MKVLIKLGMLVLTIMALSFTGLTLSGCDDDDEERAGGVTIVEDRD